MTRMRVPACGAVLCLVVAVGVRAQESVAPEQAGSAQEPAAAETLPVAPADRPAFTYDPGGRRDPFVSLVGRGAAPGTVVSARPAGLAGLQVSEVTLRGTMRSRDGFVAMLLGADQRTYIVREGDKLFDGVIRSISLDDIVFLQQVSDPLSLESEREVRKALRQVEAN